MNQTQIEQNKAELSKINKSLDSGEMWIKKYSDYQTYKSLLKEEEEVKDKVYSLKRQNPNSNEYREAQKRLETIRNQLSLLDQYKRSALGDLTHIDDLVERPSVTNPIAIFYALTYIQKAADQTSVYKEKLASLDKAIDLVEEKKKLLQKSLDYDTNSSNVELQITQITSMLKVFGNERDDFETTINIFEKKSQDSIKTLQNEIKAELSKLVIIAIIIVFIIAFAIILKVFAKRYWSDHHQERLYVVSKIANLGAIVFITITVFIAYSSNLGYMVTILGFASAGIAISLKDWFLSVLGWIIILVTGQIKAGNRIKIIGKDGEVMGDVLDVSLIKITLYEDVTLLSYVKDQRAGRIIFIPNSYIFTHIILNYNHSGMQTIWDSVYVTLSYNSDLDKATEIGKEIAQKHSKAFTRLADKQMNKLRANYNVPRYGTNPRVFTFVDKGSVILTVWFLNNYFAPMATKSAVSKDLIKALREADDIEIVYSPHSIMLQNTQMPQDII